MQTFLSIERRNISTFVLIANLLSLGLINITSLSLRANSSAQADNKSQNVGIEEEINLESIAQDPQRWQDVVLDFRQEHNFSLSLGFAESEWIFYKYAGLRNETLKTREVISRFSYTYHMALYRSLGALLGSAFGLGAPEASSQFRIAPYVMFPSLVAGVVYDLNPRYRISAALDYHLERWQEIEYKSQNKENTQISATARVSDLYVSFEWFYKIAWALKIDFHRRFGKMTVPRSATGTLFDATIEKRDSWVGLGVTYHVL